MHRISLRFAPVLVALLLSLSMVSFASAAVAPAPDTDQAFSRQDHGEDDEATTTSDGSARSTSIQEVVLWSTAALAGSLIVLTALYMLKRRIGAFPENPDWVAPIQVLYAKDAPDEGFFGDADPHTAHGAH